MSGTSKCDRNYVPHDNLRMKQNLRFMWTGIQVSLKKHWFIPLMSIDMLLIFAISHLNGTGILAGMYTALWRLAAMVVLLMGNVICFTYIGLPDEYITIMRRIERIPNFRNGDREPPVLLSRTAIDTENRIEKWVFQSFGIAFSEWSDTTTMQQIENALDISVLGVEYGADNTLTEVTLLYHPGPWPSVIPWNIKYLPSKESQICVGLNRSYPITIDLAVHPHLFIAGETGSGKSVLLTSIISQCLLQKHKIILIDMKHFVDYRDLLPYMSQTLDDVDGLHDVLENLISEMHQRLNVLKESGCPNILQFNKSHPESPMERIICVIDEYMEAIVKTGSKEQKAVGEQNEALIASLCKLSRAAGINMIFGMQRGGQEISGQIRSNTRVLLGSCSDNLSIVMTGSTELGRLIPHDSVGMFVTDNRQLFKSFYGGFEY